MYNHVNWPRQYDPKISAIYALNEIDVNAPPEVVRKLLVDAKNWSRYFPAEDQVKIQSGEPELALGTKYSRVTVGFLMNLIVTEYVPGRRISWSTVVEGFHHQSLVCVGSGRRLGDECLQRGEGRRDEPYARPSAGVRLTRRADQRRGTKSHLQ